MSTHPYRANIGIQYMFHICSCMFITPQSPKLKIIYSTDYISHTNWCLFHCSSWFVGKDSVYQPGFRAMVSSSFSWSADSTLIYPPYKEHSSWKWWVENNPASLWEAKRKLFRSCRIMKLTYLLPTWCCNQRVQHKVYHRSGVSLNISLQPGCPWIFS